MMPIDFIHICLDEQRLHAYSADALVFSMPVSTALNGPGEQNGSGCTPRGLHVIRARIGAGMPLGAVFRGRRWTGEVWDAALHAAYPGRDWILTRILWLSGCEKGVNRLGAVDTFRRYIYLHGTPDTEPMGIARSHGCIRLRNSDMLTLFNALAKQCFVQITQHAGQALRLPLRT